VNVLGVRDPVPVRRAREQRVAAIAEMQRGRVSRRQLLVGGVARGAIARLLAKGQLHPEHPGVYAVGHAAPTPLARETAALLACGDGAVLSHRSAAMVWHLLAAGRSVEVTAAEGKFARPSGVKVHRTRQLDGPDIRIHQRLPVTSPARTLLDSAGGVSRDELEQAFDDALERHLVRLSEIKDVLARVGRGRKGAAVPAAAYRARVGEKPALTRAWGERRLRHLLRAAALPTP
jgi:hypothetical protein